MTQIALPTLKTQEIPFNDARSNCYFKPTGTLWDVHTKKPFVATSAAIEHYGVPTILDCLGQLQRLAQEHHGLDYLQVFSDPTKPEALWFIEDSEGGAITALLPSEY